MKDILPQPPLGEQCPQYQSLVGQSQRQPLKELSSQLVAVNGQNL